MSKHKKNAEPGNFPVREGLAVRLGRAWLMGIIAEYTTCRSKEDFDPEEWADNPAGMAEKAMECLADKDIDQALWWAMNAAALSGGLAWIRPQEAALLADFRRRTAQAKTHRADPEKLKQGFDAMLRYHKANPTAGMTPAADYAAEQVGSISYKTLLKHFPLPLRWEAVTRNG